MPMAKRPTDGSGQARLFAYNVFDGFGPSRFRPPDDPILGRKFRSKHPNRLRKQVRAHAPRTPGVYGMIDDRGRLVYIGKAKNLRARLLSYFRPNSRDPKAGRIIEHTRRRTRGAPAGTGTDSDAPPAVQRPRRSRLGPAPLPLRREVAGPARLRHEQADG
jgi:hypothetical protein